MVNTVLCAGLVFLLWMLLLVVRLRVSRSFLCPVWEEEKRRGGGGGAGGEEGEEENNARCKKRCL